mgnify:CR=1 FL=1
MQTQPVSENEFVVVHGGGLPLHYIEVLENTTLNVPGSRTVEIFTDEEVARDRVLELDPDFYFDGPRKLSEDDV